MELAHKANPSSKCTFIAFEVFNFRMHAAHTEAILLLVEGEAHDPIDLF
jgi:hypothetical protein